MNPSIDCYHWAPLQDARKHNDTYFSLCGRDVAFFYTELEDFLGMPVKRCPECEGFVEAGFVLLGAFSLKALLEFFVPGRRVQIRAQRQPVHPV